MKQRSFVMLIILSLFVASSIYAAPKRILYSELNKKEFSKILRGAPTDLIIEFRQGDQVPVSITATGDLFEMPNADQANLTVKRNFFLNFTEMPNLLMSWDGETFVPFRELITGTFNAGFSGQPANHIYVNLDVMEKR